MPINKKESTQFMFGSGANMCICQLTNQIIMEKAIQISSVSQALLKKKIHDGSFLFAICWLFLA